MWEVFKKELIHKYYSITAYVLYVLSLLFMGILTFASIYAYNRMIPMLLTNKYYAQTYNVMDTIISPLVTDMGFLLLLIIPILTMTAFSIEKKTGTLELLLTYPISDWGIICGKFLANFLVASVIPVGFIVPLFIYAKYQPSADLNVLWTSLLGLLLLTAFGISLGVFISSLTDSPFISVILTAISLLFLWMIGPIANYTSLGGGNIADKFSLLTNFSPFTKGIVDLQNLTFFIGFTFLFLYLTLMSLETRYWTGE